MNGMPILGGISDKYAGAYLLRPKAKSKKKKKKTQDADLEKKAADVAQSALHQTQVTLQKQLRAGDLGGGWNPSDQLIDNNS